MFLDDFVLEVVRVFLGLPAWAAPGLFVLWLLLRSPDEISGE